MKFIILIISALVLSMGCAVLQTEGLNGLKNEVPLVAISDGLPTEGLWRQNIDLKDFNDDGFLDIIAPPPRKLKKTAGPSVYIWDNKVKSWKEGLFEFPELSDYGYGGIATGDLNGDGLPDIVLAVHTGKILVLQNAGDGKFVKTPFFVNDTFQSRAVSLSDINNDGWIDIIALSEGPFNPSYIPLGILVGINKIGLGWDINYVDGSRELYSDAFALADLNGDGNTDIVVVPFSAQTQGLYIWFGDGQGGFRNQEDADFAGDAEVGAVAAGDVNGDGSSEFAVTLFPKLSVGDSRVVNLLVFKWTDGKFTNMSEGLEDLNKVRVFTLSDINGDGRDELIVLTEGLSVFNYLNGRWIRQFYMPLGSYEETEGAYSLRAGRNMDGSALIAYNLGRETITFRRGIRAYMIPAEYLSD